MWTQIVEDIDDKTPSATFKVQLPPPHVSHTSRRLLHPDTFYWDGSRKKAQLLHKHKPRHISVEEKHGRPPERSCVNSVNRAPLSQMMLCTVVARPPLSAPAKTRLNKELSYWPVQLPAESQNNPRQSEEVSVLRGRIKKKNWDPETAATAPKMAVILHPTHAAHSLR